MLVIFLAAIYEKFGQDIPVDRLDSVFINTEEYFPEISDFLQLSIEEYKLALVNLQIHDLKQGFTKYLNMKPKVKAIIVGIRKIDPYAKGLQSFQITDNNWPRFIRVNPILNWEYDEIWFFLRKNKIKYCKLYDLGYTSIGGIHNTIKNPLLLKDGTEDEYFPAYCLEDKSKERLSRI
ncbi:hypothetical protein PACTADRAFT_48975 [Pachysolen tannophilus NRRL Y-2460]|uniref:FAD synthase n=1 Tax=Pachysolen tannophilus NRRL Y-2460 TaxID=669874 RepID=A0A1E4TZQ4_PACTA|nr:hypothetical protein PACTADRAFT_48975 [Pachysolen tannophilus NRRL Y-2460]